MQALIRQLRLLPVGLFAVLFLASTTGCDSESDDEPVSVLGTWERTFSFGPGGGGNFYLTFREDGTWLFRAEGETEGFEGTYSLEGRRLILANGFCGEGEGSYDVSIVSGRLVFELVEDPCFQSQIFSASWGRVIEG